MITHAVSPPRKPATSTFIPGRGLLLQRKCAYGGSAGASGGCEACRDKKRLQTKLAIGASNDPLEQEADRVADQVLATPAQFAVGGAAPRIQRFAGQPATEAATAPTSVDHVLAGSGRPLEPALRHDMEQRFGHDFSRVRVHTGTVAERSARDVHAHAYTVGHDIVFGAGRFAPGMHDGWRLIAHELAHVVQQSGADTIRAGQSDEKRGLSTIHRSPTQSSDSVSPIQSPIHPLQRKCAFDGIFIDGPDRENTPKPAAPQPAPKPKTPSTQAANCPTDVQVIYIDPLTDPQFGKNGMLTGIGAVAYMEVSGSGGKDWDGTIIQETVKQTKNTCGARAKKVCSNESGESGGFKVGAETNLLGKAKMPALRNTFYDLHVFTREVSILHELGKSGCEIQCQQYFQCGGKQFGPEFIITYMTKKDTIAKTYDVTRITVKKEAKARKS
jgi:Domain of unknown function (DUF4157)